MEPLIEIAEPKLKAVATQLNTLLADEVILYTKTRNAHWNIVGKSFHELHLFFEKQYTELEEIIDGVAERIRYLGHFALGTLHEFLNIGRLNDHNHDFSNQAQIIKTLLDDHETLIRLIRNDIIMINETTTDLGSADFLTGLLKFHEKNAWMLRSYLE